MTDLNAMILASDPFQRTATFCAGEAAATADALTDDGVEHDFDAPAGFGAHYAFDLPVAA